jgi:hypothetical protein
MTGAPVELTMAAPSKNIPGSGGSVTTENPLSASSWMARRGPSDLVLIFAKRRKSCVRNFIVKAGFGLARLPRLQYRSLPKRKCGLIGLGRGALTPAIDHSSALAPQRGTAGVSLRWTRELFQNQSLSEADASHARLADAALNVTLTLPKEFGGPGKAGATNPEQLFAAGTLPASNRH